MPDQNEKFITIVSGLPRSGTSLMMRMLEAGGIPILTDRQRQADSDNPRGYYEFEPVKQLAKDASWIPYAVGKAVKIIYVFLYHLPPTQKYKVIFLKRNLEEVVASQKVMLRNRQEGDVLADQQLMDSYNDQLVALDVWLRHQSHLAVHYVDYGETVADPLRTAFEVNQFLGLNLDTQAMAKTVEPALHRNRSAAV